MSKNQIKEKSWVEIRELPKGVRRGETYRGPGDMYFDDSYHYHVSESGVVTRKGECEQ